MTLKNNRALVLYYIKLCATFQSHWYIQTGVTVRKRTIRVKIGDFFVPVTLKIDRWPSKTIGPLFYTGLYYILVWYSRSVHPEKWHALYDVNACENHDPGKWQAMHDANACENYIAIILWRQSPYFKCMWNHQCIATQSPCYCRLFIKPPL